MENRCFCEKCNKIQEIKENTCLDTKEFNVGKISYKKSYGTCRVCKTLVYSIYLSKKNTNRINKKLRELEQELMLLKVLEDSRNGLIELTQDETEFLAKIESGFLEKSKK